MYREEGGGAGGKRVGADPKKRTLRELNNYTIFFLIALTAFL